MTRTDAPEPSTPIRYDQMQLGAQAPAVDHASADRDLPRETVLVTIERAGQIVGPHG